MAQTKKDYYEILGVAKSASKSEIKKAYRTAAMKHHPDRNPGDKAAEAKFKEASEAYEVLSDEQKRGIYDQYGHAGLSGQGYHGPQDMEDIFSSFGSIFEDFFGFGGSQSQSRRSRGADLRYDLSITFKEAVFGTEKTIQFKKKTTCESCQGNGAKPGTSPVTCHSCQGSGQVRQTQGFFSVMMTCSTCRGVGQTVEESCGTCRGNGAVLKSKKIKVKIPAGVDSGLRLRVANEGESGSHQGSNGDLYVVLNVEENPNFIRDGVDILVKQKIEFVQACLGSQVKVKTLDTEEVVTIPAGTQHGDRFKIRNLGVPYLKRSGRGDFFVEMQIDIPKKLNKAQKDILTEYAKTSNISLAKDQKSSASFFQRMFE